MMDSASDELSNLLCSDRIPCHLKYSALRYILGLSASETGMHHILTHENYLKTLFPFLTMDSQKELCETAHKCFVNISSVPHGAMTLINLMQTFIECFIAPLDNRECEHIEAKCQVLANVTRCQEACEKLASYFRSFPEAFRKLLFHFIYNDSEVKTKYDYLGLLFGNLTTCSEGKSLFLDADSPYLKYILPYTTYVESEVRRMGAAILLKNICFEIDYFKFLLEDIEILPALLLPLAGPEDFDEDEMEKLPVDLQYLGDGKQREANPHLRVLFMEALLKLCSTKYGRIYLRDKGVYYILRELHQWESFPPAVKACEDIVEILIREESDVGMDNLMEVSLPEHLAKKFEELTVSTSEREIPEIII